MRKAIVYKSGQTGQWAIRLGDHVLEPRALLGHTPTHAEAMFLAQLLADPREYIRAAQEKAWIGGWWVRDREEIGPNPYDEKDRINDNDNA